MARPVVLRRRLLAEFIGTALLVTTVVGSGIAAQQLSPDDVGIAEPQWFLGDGGQPCGRHPRRRHRVQGGRRQSRSAVQARRETTQGAEEEGLPQRATCALAEEAGCHADLVLILAFTGLRWGEAIGLCVEDVGFLKRRISVHRNAVQVGEVGQSKGKREPAGSGARVGPDTAS